MGIVTLQRLEEVAVRFEQRQRRRDMGDTNVRKGVIRVKDTLQSSVAYFSLLLLDTFPRNSMNF
jgi:hypothetical protein